jgi:type I restriction enzyme S subunit
MSRIAWAPIGDLVTIKGGGTPSKSIAKFYTGEIPWVTPKDMKTWEILSAQDKITQDAIEQSATNLVPANTVLVVNRSGILKHTLPVAITRRPVAINQDMKALICGDRVDPDYLARMVKAAESIILGWVRATTADNYPIENLKSLGIPLPPLEEQKRIAAILDQADSLRRLRQRAIDRLNTLGQAFFYEMFGDPLANPMRWHVAELGTLSEVVRGSSPRPQGDPAFFGGPVPRLMIADITRDGMKVTPCIDSLTEAGARRSRPMSAGSVVMAVSGAVGLPAILEVDACIHDGFVGFRSLDNRVVPEFLYQLLLLQRQRNRARGTGAIWVNLTTDQVKRFPVPLPSKEQQAAYLEKVASSYETSATCTSHSQYLAKLFSSLQHRAFRGEL